MANTLVKKLLSQFDLKDEESFFQLKELLGVAAAGLKNDGSLPEEPSKLSGFRLAQQCLYELRSYRKNCTTSGILFKGVPFFFTEKLFREVQDEMKSHRQQALEDRWGQFISKPGPVIDKFAKSEELRKFVESYVGCVSDEIACTCIYYDKPGAQIPPHVDVDNFCVNMNILIRHEASGEKSSDFILYPIGTSPKKIDYAPGDSLLFYADSFVHSRTPLTSGETVYAISIGFRPIGEIHKDERVR